MMRSFIRKVSHWVNAAALVGCLLLSVGCNAGKSREKPTPTPLPTSAVSVNPTYTVQRGEVVKELNVKGRVVPVIEQRLFFRNSGYVRQVFVQRDDFVNAGQVLADLEIGDLENQLAQAETNLKASELQLASARQVISDTLTEAQIALTIEQLRLEEAKYNLKIDSRTPRKIEVQIQEEQVKLAELRVQQLERGVDPQLVQSVELVRLTVERLKVQVADSSILAPFDGKVLSTSIQKGDSVTAFNQTVITVYDPNQLEVSVELSSELLKELTEGVTVMLKLTRPADKTWAGIVRQLPYPYGKGGLATGSSDTKDTTTRITFNASPEEAGYELGDLVDVQMVLQHKSDVFWLPPEALRNFEGRKFVVVQEGERQRRVNVTIGIESERRIEIVDGLVEGQIVVSP